jgi:hypothetical protein
MAALESIFNLMAIGTETTALTLLLMAAVFYLVGFSIASIAAGLFEFDAVHAVRSAHSVPASTSTARYRSASRWPCHPTVTPVCFVFYFCIGMYSNVAAAWLTMVASFCVAGLIFGSSFAATPRHWDFILTISVVHFVISCIGMSIFIGEHHFNPCSGAGVPDGLGVLGHVGALDHGMLAALKGRTKDRA